MRKIITAILLTLGFLTTSLVTASPAYADYSCSLTNDRASTTFEDDRRSVFVQANVIYRYCTSPTEREFVKPLRSISSYYIYGGPVTCSAAMRYLDGVSFNYYAWETHSGKNFNPPGITLLCDESNQNSYSQEWNSERLYYGPDWTDHPRWKVNVTLKRNFNTDKDWAHAQNFRPAS